jgi:hypothetical protein
MKEKQELTYVLLLLGLNLIPATIPHLLVRQMWYGTDIAQSQANFIELGITTVILPLLLPVTNWELNKRYNQKAFIVNCVLILFVIWVSSMLHFRNWVDSMGNWDNPDHGTVVVRNFALYTGITLSVIAMTIVMITMNKKLGS